MSDIVELRELSLEYAPMMVEATLESVLEINSWMDWCTPEFSIETAEKFITEQINAKTEGATYEFSVFSK